MPLEYHLSDNRLLLLLLLLLLLCRYDCRSAGRVMRRAVKAFAEAGGVISVRMPQ